jgi:hypothetical protein
LTTVITDIFLQAKVLPTREELAQLLSLITLPLYHEEKHPKMLLALTNKKNDTTKSRTAKKQCGFDF